MTRVWDANHQRIDATMLKRLVVLLCLAHRSAVVGLTSEEHGRCFDIANE